jgi:hypothetical protein
MAKILATTAIGDEGVMHHKTVAQAKQRMRELDPIMDKWAAWTKAINAVDSGWTEEQREAARKEVVVLIKAHRKKWDGRRAMALRRRQQRRDAKAPAQG